MPEPKSKARVINIDGLFIIYDGHPNPILMFAEPSRIEGSCEGGVAYKPEKVILINGELEIRKLKEHLDDVCAVLDQYKEYKQKLSEAEKKCHQCSKYQPNNFWPNKTECAGCDNMELAIEAFERYT